GLPLSTCPHTARTRVRLLLYSHHLDLGHPVFEGSHKALHVTLAALLARGQGPGGGHHGRHHCNACRGLREPHGHPQGFPCGPQERLLPANRPCRTLPGPGGDPRGRHGRERGCEHLVITPWHTDPPVGEGRTGHETADEPDHHGP